MPHSKPVSDLMSRPSRWPQLRADATVEDALKILRILSEDKKLEHGHSTPLVMDDDYNLLGFIRLTDLLKSVRHLCVKTDEPCEISKADMPLREIVTRFAGSVTSQDSILKALDIMMDNDVSLVPVMKDGKLEGIIKLGDIFNTVSALLFDEQNPTERSRLLDEYHF
jgi:CBS domain-containing protein